MSSSPPDRSMPDTMTQRREWAPLLQAAPLALVLLLFFVFPLVATGIVTEASYRYIETPIRKGTMGASLARIARSPVAGQRNALLGVGAVVLARKSRDEEEVDA